MLTCKKCSRSNPAQATYCYFDGVALSRAVGHAGGPAMPTFTAPFTFPTGLACRDFDQLGMACQENWSTALELLKQGQLEKFLKGQGRADLAQAAQEASRFPDRDRGLDQFLARLPSRSIQPPRLRVEPSEINLGVLRLGEDRKVVLNLENQGMRLVYGSVTVADAPWLSVGARPGAQQKLFQFGSELGLPVNVIGKRLRASNKPLEGKLIIESNGGNVIVPIRADVPIKPYPDGVLAGAKSPRQIAEKAKANPKEAAVSFEKGNVAQWYKDNGWTYPVRGPAASGLGAVQQFYEALGLTPPPKVEISAKQVNLTGQPGQAVSQTLELRSEEKRPVYAHAVSDQPWLEVGRARLAGRVAGIPLRVSNVPDRPGETLQAKLTVTSNGNQRFVIPVTLRVGDPLSAIAALPATAGKAGPLVAMPRRPATFNKAHLLPAVLLALACFLVIVWDLTRDPYDGGAVGPGIGGEEDPAVKGTVPSRRDAKSNELHVGVQFTRESSRFGIVCNMLRDPINPEERKKLTRDLNGYSNNLCFRVDGYENLFRENPGIRWVRDKQTNKLILEAPIPNGIYGDRVPTDRGWRTMLHDEHHRITITQDVEIIVGASGYYDTVLVSYQITNEDRSSHTVGLRFMLDTYVGSADGVPINYPPHGQPLQPGGFVDGLKIFPQKDVPDYLQAVEKGDLTATKDNTVAVLGLRLGSRFELPEKVVVCRWPQNSEAKWGGTGRLGDWKYERIDANPHVPDSCVLIYWGELSMAPGSQRKMAFTYGLGRMGGFGDDSGETVAQGKKGQLRMFVPQNAWKGKPFAVTSYIRTTEPGQKITLLPPSGIRLVPGQSAEQPVPPPISAGYSAVSWQVIADEKGPYELKSRVDSIGTASVNVPVRERGLFDSAR